MANRNEPITQTLERRTRTVEHVDIDLPGARSLRVELTRDPDGSPDALNISSGWTDPYRPDAVVRVPGYLIDDLRRALEALHKPKHGASP